MSLSEEQRAYLRSYADVARATLTDFGHQLSEREIQQARWYVAVDAHLAEVEAALAADRAALDRYRQGVIEIRRRVRDPYDGDARIVEIVDSLLGRQESS